MDRITEDLPYCIQGYYPLSDLERNSITLTGIQYTRIDSALSEETIEALKRSEAVLLRKEKYSQFLYLLEEHDYERVYKETFLDNNEIGKVHLSLLINEKPSQTYAELAAAFSLDKRIPFIAGLIMLEDFKKSAGELYYYARTKNISIYEKKWTPPESINTPPIKYRKLFISNYQSACNISDSYILATLKDFCFNKGMAKRALGINNYQFQKTLERQDVINRYGIPDKLKIEKILEQTILDMADQQTEYRESVHTEIRSSVTGSAPPEKRVQQDKDAVYVSDELLMDTYRKYGNNIERTARELDLSYSYVYFHICKLTKQDIYVYSHEYCEEPAALIIDGIPIYDPKEEIEYDSEDFSDLSL